MSITFNRTTWIRLAAIVLILAFSVFLFFIGRQHTVLVDNKTITVNGTEVKALQLVEVQINKLDALELAARDRDKFEVTGQTHEVKVVYTDSNWEEHVITRKFKIPLMQDMVMTMRRVCWWKKIILCTEALKTDLSLHLIHLREMYCGNIRSEIL